MKRGGKRMRTRLRVRPRLAIKTLIFLSAGSSALIILITLIVNFADTGYVKAVPIEIRQVDEQIFTNEMSLPHLQIKPYSSAGPNTIFIHGIKHSNELPTEKHE